MYKNEIKKMLYREKPEAFLKYIKNGVAYYSAGDIQFEIPVSDMGDAKFSYIMGAQFLCRWIVLGQGDNQI